MLSFILEIVVAMSLAQAPATTNQACATLTTAQVSSLIGTARTMPVTSAGNGSSCMFQNEEKMITVLVATVSSPDAATGLFNSKKRVAAGADIAGWGVPAYSASVPTAAVVGVLKQQTLTEVKLLDKTAKPEVLAAKLQAVMKDVAARK